MTEQSGGGDDGVVDTPLEESTAPVVAKEEGEVDLPLDSDEVFGDDVENDIREGETPEESLQRRIEEGKIGKGKTLRRWKDTEQKQRLVESGRHESKVQRYGQIYDEVRALRKETRHSVEDLRERFKEKGVIQNKDQFIVRLIAQERNEQEGKVAAIKSLQQWRLTDVELHNFINRCHKKGISGKLDLAKQWAFEQEEAGGEVNFKQGLAFYSSIGILQPRSSAHTQQQWREWREWEDAMTSAIDKRKSGAEGPPGEEGAEPAAADASCNEDSTVCNSPWSSERGGGGGSFGGNGSLRACSTHGEGDAAGGYGSSRFRSRSGTAPEASKDAMRLPGRGRTPANRDSPSRQKRGWWTWRSYSPPSSTARQKSAELGKAAREKRASADGNGLVGGAVAAAATAATADGGNGRLLPSPARLEPPEGGGGKLGEAVVRAGGGYLPPRHPLAALQLSPTGTPGGGVSEVDPGAESGGSSGGEGTPTLGAVPNRRGPMARGAARTRAKGPAGDGTVPLKPAVEAAPVAPVAPAPAHEEDAPTEEVASKRRPDGKRGEGGRVDGRPASLSGVLSGLADWLMPGMDVQNHARHRVTRVESGDDLYVRPSTPPHRVTKSAPVTPRGRRPASSVLRDGGWFYNGDSDYSTEEETGSFESEEDEGFWGDVGTTEPPRTIGGGGGVGILERLKMLFT